LIIFLIAASYLSRSRAKASSAYCWALRTSALVLAAFCYVLIATALSWCQSAFYSLWILCATRSLAII
jgi:succinate dehydrogenase hydrophobic anchor subunit